MMSDWFSELVDQLSDEIVGSGETESRLTLTDRVDRGKLKATAVDAEGELRRQFADRLAAVQTTRERIEQAEQEALAPEWRRVQLARHRVESMHTSVAVRPGRLERVLQRGVRRSGLSVPEAQRAVEDAERAYEAAKVANSVGRIESIRNLEAHRSEQVSELRGPLRLALQLKVNGAIDDAIEASYGTEFSYAEPAVLTDPLEVSMQPVSTAAYQKVKYLVDKVGSGTIGVAGPRGSGKSTLLSQFAATVKIDDQPRQWGMCVPAPAKYDPRDFLLFVFAQLCVQALGRERADQVEDRLTSTAPSAADGLLRGLLLAAAVAVAICGAVIGLRTARPVGSSHMLTDLSIASGCAIVLAATLAATLVVVPGRTVFMPGGRPWTLPRIIFIPLLRRRPLPAVLAGLVTAALFTLLANGIVPDPGYLAAAGLGATSIAVLVIAIRPSPLTRNSSAGSRSDSRLPYLSEAERWYAKVKFQQSYTTGWSGTITAGPKTFPVQAQGGSTGSTAVTPLAMSTPEIIAALRSFTGSLARPFAREPTWTGSVSLTRIPVVIGIDEIDKIEDPQDAQAFLNQIKGLFGDSNCLFLVSISDDAMAAFERRGVPFRDAFDSSLSSVVVLSYMSRKEARALIGSRLVGVQEPVADLLFMLSGGLARDLVRLIRRAVEAREQGKTQLNDLALALIAAETNAKKAAVLAVAGTPRSCPAQVGLLTWAGTRQGGPVNAGEYFSSLLAAAVSLLEKACDGSAHQAASPASGGAADGAACPAAEIGAFCFWLASVGQVLAACSSRDDFQQGENPDSSRSFQRLAEARQNFALGPDYVLTTITALRKEWALPEPDPPSRALQAVFAESPPGQKQRPAATSRKTAAAPAGASA